MGKCCSKPEKDTDDYVPLSKHQKYSGDQMMDKFGKEYGESSESEETKSAVSKTADVVKDSQIKTENDFLQTSKLPINDITYKYKLGIFFDERISMWFRVLFVSENDTVRKHFMSFYNLNLNIMTEQEFLTWCDENGFPETKKYYGFYKLLDYFPYSRILNALTNKYSVKFHISDIFTFKGKGLCRAITCGGPDHMLVDKALNEYELRMPKKEIIFGIHKHWDNKIFLNPTIDMRDHSKEFPFPWPKRIRPVVPECPKWPFRFSKASPSVFLNAVSDAKPMSASDAFKSYALFGERNLNAKSPIKFHTSYESEIRTNDKSTVTTTVNQTK